MTTTNQFFTDLLSSDANEDGHERKQKAEDIRIGEALDRLLVNEDFITVMDVFLTDKLNAKVSQLGYCTNSESYMASARDVQSIGTFRTWLKTVKTNHRDAIKYFEELNEEDH